MRKNVIYQRPVTLGSVLKFTLPTVVMSVLQSLYTMVDGVFIANFMGTEALSALTLISPYFSVLTALSAMLASGGSAVVMRKMGEGRELEAKEDFTALLLYSVLTGAVFTVAGPLLAGGLSQTFGASPAVAGYCRAYLSTYLLFSIPALLFSNLQIYVIASNSSVLALVSAVAGGVTNVALDALFMGVWGLGMEGAAAATGLGMLVPSLIIGIYFLGRGRMLHFVRPKFRSRVLWKTVTNGSSELCTNLISGLTIFLFNAVLLREAGEEGVAASTIIFYVFGFLGALYIGYVYGVAPMFSYYLGEGNREKMGRLTRINLGLIALFSGLTALASVAGSGLLVSIFARPDTAVYAMAVHGNRLFSLALLLIGFNTYASGLFTALSNGLVSAVIALGRTFVFLVGALLLLPRLLGLDGVWLAVPAAELLTFFVALFCFLKFRSRYGY